MISEDEILNTEAPFFVVGDCSRGKRKGQPKKEKQSKIVGFSINDPLGVGGDFFPENPTAYFENGGWLLVSDLMRYYSIVEV